MNFTPNDILMNEEVITTKINENDPDPNKIVVRFHREYTGNQKFLFVTENWLECAGHSAVSTMNSLNLTDIIFHDDKKRTFDYMQMALLQQSDWTIPYRIRTKQGLNKWVEEKAHYVYNPDGSVRYIEGTITEMLIDNEDFFKNLSFQNALNSASIVSITDKKGTILYVNDLFCYYSRYKREELIGRSHNLLNSGLHSKSFFRDMWTTIASGKIWRGEIRNKSKDGSYYWVDTVIAPVFNKNGEIDQFVSIRNIVTDKKRTELLLKNVYAGVTINTGNEFFNQLTHYCCSALNVKYSFVARYSPQEKQLETISFRSKEGELKQQEIKLSNSPFEALADKKICSYSAEILKFFPDHSLLTELQVESLLAIPIKNEKGEILGVISLMDDKPTHDLFDKEFVVSFLAQRVGNELAKHLAEVQLTELDEFYKLLNDSDQIDIVLLDENGHIIFMNSAFKNTLNENNYVKNKSNVNYFLEFLLSNSKGINGKVFQEIYHAIDRIHSGDETKLIIKYKDEMNNQNYLISISKFNSGQIQLRRTKFEHFIELD